MVIDNILKELPRFVCQKFTNEQLLEIQQSLATYSDEEILLATLAAMPKKKDMMAMTVQENNEPMVQLESTGSLQIQPSKLSVLSC